MKFKIGDRVKLKKDSVYFLQSNNGEGIIENIYISDTWINVLWDHGSGNIYSVKDLIRAKPLTAKQLNKKYYEATQHTRKFKN